MTKEAQRAELHKTIWRIANDLRGSVDGWDFKQYVLGMLFYRFISENLTAYLNAGEHAAGDTGFDYGTLPDAEAERGRADTVTEKGFFILPSELFRNVRARAAKDENLNETLERVFKNRDFDLTIIAHTEPLDIANYARDDYYFQYRNPEFKALIETIDHTVDETERNRLYGDAQRMLARDAVNGFLFILPKITVTKADLEGMWTDWPLPLTPLAEVKWR